MLSVGCNWDDCQRFHLNLFAGPAPPTHQAVSRLPTTSYWRATAVSWRSSKFVASGRWRRDSATFSFESNCKPTSKTKFPFALSLESWGALGGTRKPSLLVELCGCSQTNRSLSQNEPFVACRIGRNVSTRLSTRKSRKR